MPFEVFTHDIVTATSQAFVSIQKDGVLALNKAAYALLEDPEAVELLYDRDRMLVGLRKAAAGVQHARRVRTNTNKTTYLVSGAQFVNYYGIQTGGASRRWPAHLEDNILVVNIGEPPVP